MNEKRKGCIIESLIKENQHSKTWSSLPQVGLLNIRT